MVSPKKAVKKAPVKVATPKKRGAMGMAESIAVKLLDKNHDGFIKDDLFTMAMNFLKKKFAKK